MTETKSQEVQAPALTQNFPLPVGDSQIDLSNILAENLGDETLSPFDLDRVTVPPGGVTTFQLPGEEESKTLDGVIIKAQKSRAFWKESMGGEGGSPPDCVSYDMEHGIGEPGGECETCPNNKFGSGQSGHNKACKETMHIYMLQAEMLLPIIIQVPPSSLRNYKKYAGRLISKARSINGVVTRFSLKKENSKGGTAYASLQMEDVGDLSQEQYKAVQDYRKGLDSIMNSASSL